MIPGRSIMLGAAIAMLCASSALADDMSSMGPVTVQINSQNQSGESGTATLTQQSDGLHVVIALANTPDGVAQPAHIHKGTCDVLNKAPQWPLKPVVDGKSETVLPDVTLADVTGGKYAINVHKSADDLPAYVACGDIK
jgi:hypothetical protein